MTVAGKEVVVAGCSDVGKGTAASFKAAGAMVYVTKKVDKFFALIALRLKDLKV